MIATHVFDLNRFSLDIKHVYVFTFTYVLSHTSASRDSSQQLQYWKL